jgi:hypothetical protein
LQSYPSRPALWRPPRRRRKKSPSALLPRRDAHAFVVFVHVPRRGRRKPFLLCVETGWPKDYLPDPDLLLAAGYAGGAAVGERRPLSGEVRLGRPCAFRVRPGMPYPRRWLREIVRLPLVLGCE